MTPLETIGWAGLTLVGLVGSATASGMETGIYSVNRVRLHLRSSGSHVERSAQILESEIARPDRVLSVLLITNNVFNYLGAMGITALLAGAGFKDGGIIAINALVLTPLLFVFGESLPKDLFRVEADRLTVPLARLLRAARILLTVVLLLPLVEAAGRFAARMIGSKDGDSMSSTRQRIATMLKETAGQGVISESQAGLVDRALLFSSRRVADVMVAWSQVPTLSERWTRSQAMTTLRKAPFSRFPVLNDNGRVVRVVDELDVYADAEAAMRAVGAEAVFLRPNMTLPDALAQLRATGSPMGIVGTADAPIGLVTQKDLVEPLIGPVQEW